jgi:hypothetical protein
MDVWMRPTSFAAISRAVPAGSSGRCQDDEASGAAKAGHHCSPIRPPRAAWPAPALALEGSKARVKTWEKRTLLALSAIFALTAARHFSDPP